jgi:uncharacterized protein YdaU (DUF1376 family)
MNDLGLRVVYFELLNALYLEGGELPADPAKLADNLLLPEKEIARVLPILSKGLGAIEIRNGRLSQPRVTKELQRYRRLSKKRRDAARSRWDASAYQADADGKQDSKSAVHGAKAKAYGSKAMAQALEVFEYWKSRTEQARAVPTRQRLETLARRVREDPDGVAGLKCAVDGAVADPFYRGDNDRGKQYWGFDNVFRNRDRIEKLQQSAKRYGRPGYRTSAKTPPKLPPKDAKAMALFADARSALKTPARTRRTWLDPCQGWAFENEGTVLIVACPSKDHATWLRGHFKEPLKAALHERHPGILVRAVVREVTP